MVQNAKENTLENRLSKITTITSFIGGLALGTTSSIFLGRDFTDMVNDFRYSSGVGYMIPAIYGALVTDKKSKFIKYLINISAAEAGYVIGSKFGV